MAEYLYEDVEGNPWLIYYHMTGYNLRATETTPAEAAYPEFDRIELATMPRPRPDMRDFVSEQLMERMEAEILHCMEEDNNG